MLELVAIDEVVTLDVPVFNKNRPRVFRSIMMQQQKKRKENESIFEMFCFSFSNIFIVVRS